MKRIVFLLPVVLLAGCRAGEPADADRDLDYCLAQAAKTLQIPHAPEQLAGNIENGDSTWRWTSPGSWTSGFWPGVLWYCYEYSGDSTWLQAARAATAPIIPAVVRRARTHDVGFVAFCSIGNGYRLTGDQEYKAALIGAADSLSALFNPAVGTWLSWPHMRERMGWPHNTIIDNLMNMELMFWAGLNGGGRHLYDMAKEHCETTMENHFRPDMSTWHVIVYDDKTGQKITGVTHQGHADHTMWARGQAWAIYGFTMAYRFTRDERFLQTARRAADVYLSRLPGNGVPYWDFDDPAIPDSPRDASAAAIVASALMELQEMVEGDAAKSYRSAGERMLAALGSVEYRSGEANPSFLLHSTGHHPNGTEVDASIIYADYYYMEALLRLKKLQLKRSIYDNFR